MKHLFLSALILLGLSSCQIAGLTSGYSHLSDAQKERVVALEENIDDIHDFSKVYTVSINQVKQYIETHDRVLLYDYTPFCRSTYCVSPSALVSQCKDKGINVLVISNIYDDIFKQKHTTFPMLMIDTKQFPTKWRSKIPWPFLFTLDRTYRQGTELRPVFITLRKGKYIKSFKSPTTFNPLIHGRIIHSQAAEWHSIYQ